MNDTSDVSSAVVYNSTGFPIPGNGIPNDVDVTYIYSDPQYWRGLTSPIHNLDDRLTDQVYYVLDPTNTNGQYNGMLGGHELEPLRDALTETVTDPNTHVISEAALVQIIADEMTVAGQLLGPPRAAAEIAISDAYSALPNEVFHLERHLTAANQCFPSGTLITLADGTTEPFEDITPTDAVLSFDASGNATVGIVDKTFTNTTAAFAILSFADGRDDLILTAGHRVSTETGDYMEIDHMLKLGGGTARLTDSHGNIVEATGEIVAYMAQTADMFPVTARKTIAFEGSAVLGQEGWTCKSFAVSEISSIIFTNPRRAA